MRAFSSARSSTTLSSAGLQATYRTAASTDEQRLIANHILFSPVGTDALSFNAVGIQPAVWQPPAR
jgi:hypothetical protein